MLFTAMTLMAAPVMVGLLIWTLWRLQRSRRRQWLIAAVAIASCEGLCIKGSYDEFHYFDGFEWNPSFEPEEFVGTWALEDQMVSFDAADFGPGPQEKGRWSAPPGTAVHDHRWQAIRMHGETLLMRDPPAEPDEWNIHRVFERRRKPCVACADVSGPAEWIVARGIGSLPRNATSGERGSCFLAEFPAEALLTTAEVLGSTLVTERFSATIYEDLSVASGPYQLTLRTDGRAIRGTGTFDGALVRTGAGWSLAGQERFDGEGGCRVDRRLELAQRK